MSEPELRDVDVTHLDLSGLSAEVGQAFKPHFTDVETRARRIRRTRLVGAAAMAVGVLLAGGTAFAAVRTDAALAPATKPSPSVGPWTVNWHGSPRSPAPQPGYVEITPGHYDVAEPDKPLTGMFTELRAGDLDHLYLEYQDCKGGSCVRMLAASADRGRTWRKLQMPRGLVVDPRYQSIVGVHGTTLVATDSKLARIRELSPEQRVKLQDQPDTYWVTTDGGITWRRPTIRTGDALPVGWPYLNVGAFDHPAIAAFNPATGDILLAPQPREAEEQPLDLPDAAGIWIIIRRYPPLPSPLPTAPVIREGSMGVAVSRDGGRTWEQRSIPREIFMREGGGSGFSSNQIATADGRTVYAVQKLKNRVRLFVSLDGAATWRAGAEVDLGGPLLTLLPTREGALILASDKATWRSTDQGRTFTKVGPALGSRGYPLPGGGYAIPTNNNEYSVWLSKDGSNWSYVGRPDVP